MTKNIIQKGVVIFVKPFASQVINIRDEEETRRRRRRGSWFAPRVGEGKKRGGGREEEEWMTGEGGRLARWEWGVVMGGGLIWFARGGLPMNIRSVCRDHLNQTWRMNMIFQRPPHLNPSTTSSLALLNLLRPPPSQPSPSSPDAAYTRNYNWIRMNDYLGSKSMILF